MTQYGTPSKCQLPVSEEKHCLLTQAYKALLGTKVWGLTCQSEKVPELFSDSPPYKDLLNLPQCTAYRDTNAKEAYADV